ncbi:MAG: Hsp20/alpha crystallin family protein [Luteolibacter sp.]
MSTTLTDTPRPTTIRPAFSTCEDDAGFRVSVAVPGVRKEDLKLSFRDGLLDLEAPRPGDGSAVYRLTSRLERRLDGDRIEAKHENGVLEILIPLRQEALPKSIQIS